MADRPSDRQRLNEFATGIAETFVSAYYAAYDSVNRVNLIPTLYLPSASVVWNGTPVNGAAEVASMMASVPGTKHEVQGFDVQVLGSGAQGVSSVLLVVFGNATHHTPAAVAAQAAQARSNAPRSSDSRKEAPPIDSLARSFSQNFVLVNVPAGTPGAPGTEGGVSYAESAQAGAFAGRYFVQSEAFRFVG